MVPGGELAHGVAQELQKYIPLCLHALEPLSAVYSRWVLHTHHGGKTRALVV